MQPLFSLRPCDDPVEADLEDVSINDHIWCDSVVKPTQSEFDLVTVGR